MPGMKAFEDKIKTTEDEMEKLKAEMKVLKEELRWLEERVIGIQYSKRTGEVHQSVQHGEVGKVS